MSVRKIIQRGDPVLNKKAHPVTSFDEKLHALLDEMKETLDRADGVGLAAPQLGLLRRVVLVIDTNDDNKPIELVNPRIIASSGEERGVEGCLSVAGLYGYVTRPTEVTVEAQDRYGETFTVTGTGLTARCFCHELDHLEGHLFVELTDQLYTSEEIDELEAEKNGKKREKRGRRAKKG